ncbi:MAG: hypothetical protein QOD42_897 [Sphingomonadales bacterium]|nr:hypothetical protein [Sphingomonadales bacterium]
MPADLRARGGDVTSFLAVDVSATGRPEACRVLHPGSDGRPAILACDLLLGRGRYPVRRPAPGAAVAARWGVRLRWETLDPAGLARRQAEASRSVPVHSLNRSWPDQGPVPRDRGLAALPPVQPAEAPCLSRHPARLSRAAGPPRRGRRQPRPAGRSGAGHHRLRGRNQLRQFPARRARLRGRPPPPAPRLPRGPPGLRLRDRRGGAVDRLPDNPLHRQRGARPLAVPHAHRPPILSAGGGLVRHRLGPVRNRHARFGGGRSLSGIRPRPPAARSRRRWSGRPHPPSRSAPGRRP